MKPEEIKPDTKLCTILGYNAQTGQTRKYFNKWLKRRGVNATAIALNITDEHFDFTMRSVGASKVDRMMIEQEFGAKALSYCARADETSQRQGRVDFVEIVSGEIEGFCLDDAVEALFDKPEFIDERMRFVARMMLVAQRWYGVPVEVDEIPLLIEN